MACVSLDNITLDYVGIQTVITIKITLSGSLIVYDYIYDYFSVDTMI